MKNSIIMIIIITIIVSSPLKSQESFSIQLDETQTLQEMLDILTNSKALNFGEWHPNPTVEDPNYYIRINSGTVDLIGSSNSIYLSLQATAYAEFNVAWNTFGFSHSESIYIDVLGTPSIENDLVTGLSNIVVNDISVILTFDIWPDWLPQENIVTVNLEDHYMDLSFINLVEFYPDLDPFYFQSNFPELTVTDNAIFISVSLNQELELANKSIANPTGYLNGSLSLENTDIPELTQTNKPSPSLLFARQNDDYSATTHDRIIGNEVHLSWTNDVDHKLTTDQFPLLQEYFTEGVIAWYTEQRTITIASTPDGAGMDFHDPWYYDEATQIQPDDFRPISSGQYQVFLEQNPDFLPTLPIYHLKAASSYATGREIYAFHHWEGRDVDFGNSNNRETTIVFHSGDAIAEAVYVNALLGIGAPVFVASDETLIVPAGGNYQWGNTAFDFSFYVEGTLIMEGTEQDRITFCPTSGTTFMIGGIYIDNGGTLICDYVDFDYSQYALTGDAIVVDNGNAQITNCRFTNILMDAVDIHSTATAFIANSEFTGDGGSGIGIECIVIHGSGHTVKLWNNTIVDFSTGIAAIVTETENGPAFDMRNNIIYYGLTPNSGTVGLEVEITNFLYTELDYNLIYGFASSGTENIHEAYIHHLIETDDPDFVKYSTGNYTLTSGSPCRDTGEMDLDGDGDIWDVDPDDQDPDGTRMDMGAYYYDAVPSKPTNFTISGYIGQHPTIRWTLCPDTDIAEYQIWRRLTDHGPQYSLRSTVGSSTSEYVDTEITISAGRRMTPKACYKVRAVDNIDQMSAYTRSKCKPYGAVGKEVVELLPLKYAVHTNYPNPFNRRTTIAYDLPEESVVTLTIYDFLGNEINTLISAQESAGYKYLDWDGTNHAGKIVASGMYIYTLKAQSVASPKTYLSKQKMIFLK